MLDLLLPHFLLNYDENFLILCCIQLAKDGQKAQAREIARNIQNPEIRQKIETSIDIE